MLRTRPLYHYTLALTLFASTSLSSTQVFANPVQKKLEALEATLQQQQKKLEEQAALLEAQKKQIEALSAQATQLKDVNQTAVTQSRLVEQTQAQAQAQAKELAGLKESLAKLQEADKARPAVTLAAGRPRISTADGNFSFSPRVFLQLDAAHYFQREERPLAVDFRRGSVGANVRDTTAAGDLSDGVVFRRARFGFEGTLGKVFNYRLDLDLGGSGIENPGRISQAWISYTGFAPVTLQFGAFIPPGGMDDSQSVEDQVFVERAAPADLARSVAGADERLGFNVRYVGKRLLASLTATTRSINGAEVFDNQLAFVGRLGYLAATDKNYNVHLDLSGTYVASAADQGITATGARFPIRLRQRPELRVDGAQLLDTGTIDSDNLYIFGTGFGANYKNYYVQAEYFNYGITRRNSALSDPRFDGFYVQSTWVLTGESRRYSVASGSFQNPRPAKPFTDKGGTGAFELTARYSRLDLDHRAGNPGTPALAESVRGGIQKSITLGLNWYPNQNIKFLFNYINTEVDRLNPAGPGNLTPFGASPMTPPLGVDIGQTFNAVVLRSQYSF